MCLAVCEAHANPDAAARGPRRHQPHSASRPRPHSRPPGPCSDDPPTEHPPSSPKPNSMSGHETDTHAGSEGQHESARWHVPIVSAGCGRFNRRRPGRHRLGTRRTQALERDSVAYCSSAMVRLSRCAPADGNPIHPVIASIEAVGRMSSGQHSGRSAGNTRRLCPVDPSNSDSAHPNTAAATARPDRVAP